MHLTRIECGGDGVDDAALAGGVAPFENHHDPSPLVLHPTGDTIELEHHRLKCGFVFAATERCAGVRFSFCHDEFLRNRKRLYVQAAE